MRRVFLSKTRRQEGYSFLKSNKLVACLVVVAIIAGFFESMPKSYAEESKSETKQNLIKEQNEIDLSKFSTQKVISYIIKSRAELNADYKAIKPLVPAINKVKSGIDRLYSDVDMLASKKDENIISLLRGMDAELSNYRYIQGKTSGEDKTALSELKLALSKLMKKLSIAETGILIYADEEKVQKQDAAPILINSRTMVPLRLVSEALGAQVEWLNKERAVVIIKDASSLYIQLGEKFYLKNGEKQNIDVPATIVNDRTYVPIRFVSEALGKRVEWQRLSAENDIVGIFSNDLDDHTRHAAMNRISQMVELESRIPLAFEKDAYKILEQMPTNKKKVEAICTLSEYKNGIRYEVADLKAQVLNFMSYAEGKDYSEVREYIKKISDNMTKEDFLNPYDISIEQILAHKKLVIIDESKLEEGDEFFKVNVAIIDKEREKSYGASLLFGQSKNYENLIKMHELKMWGNGFKPVDKQKKGDAKKEYEVIYSPEDRVWTLGKSANSSRTAFGIQRLKEDGSYGEEYTLNYTIDDDWTKYDMQDKYKYISDEFANLLLGKLGLDAEKIVEFKTSAYKINVYAEILLVDPTDKKSKWYRLHNDSGDPTAIFRLIDIADKFKAKALVKSILERFPNNDEKKTTVFSHEIKAEKLPNWVLKIKFVDDETKAEIAPSKTVINEVSTSPFKYDPPEIIDGIYKIKDKSTRKIEFSLDSKKPENLELVLAYEPMLKSAEESALLLEEWQLSKFVPSISKELDIKLNARATALIPYNPNIKNREIPGILLPSGMSDYKVRATSSSNNTSIFAGNTVSLYSSFANFSAAADVDAKIHINRQNLSKSYFSPQWLDQNEYKLEGAESLNDKGESENNESSSSGLLSLRLRLEHQKPFEYRKISSELFDLYSDGTPKYSYYVSPAKPVETQYDDAFVNASIAYLNYTAKEKPASTFEGTPVEQENKNEFAETKSSKTSFKVLPEIMMIYSNESGEYSPQFVLGSEYRSVNPLEFYKGYLNDDFTCDINASFSKDERAKALANAMEKTKLPVLEKNSTFSIKWKPKNTLILKSYALDIASEALKEKWGSSKYSTTMLMQNYVSDLIELTKPTDEQKSSNEGYKNLGKTITANINMAIEVSGKKYAALNSLAEFKKLGEEQVDVHKITIRGGRVTEIDGAPLADAKKELQQAIESMKLGVAGKESVLASFAKNEGRKLNDKTYSDISKKYRGIDAEQGVGWYSEDSTTLVIVEKTQKFQANEQVFEFRIPSNISGIETPLEESMRYSRGEVAKLLSTISLNNKKDAVLQKTIDDLFIIPNSELDGE